MLSKIKKYLNKEDNNSLDKIKVGILPDNDLLSNFKELDVIYNDFNQDIPYLDVCFVDNSIPLEKIEEINQKTDILISLGSCISFKADLILPGASIDDDFLNNIVIALIEDDLEYLKPLLEMTKDNTFRTKTILIILNNELCVGCSGCAFICPVDAINMENTRPNIDFNKCVHCGCCFTICPKSWNLQEEVEAWC